MAQWELWEKRTPTGGSSVFLCADHADAEAMRQHARRNGQVLTWTTEATTRREAERALWAAKGGRGAAIPKPHVHCSPRVRRVQQLGEEEALALRHDFLAPEHLVLGLVREGEGIGAKALTSAGVTLEAARAQVATSIPATPARSGTGNALTRATSAALQAADTYAETDAVDAIGTDHLLLGLTDDPDSPATNLLRELGVSLEELRANVQSISRQTHAEDEAGPEPTPTPRLISTTPVARFVRRLRRWSPVRPIGFWLRTRKGVTTKLMDNWAPVNLRYVNGRRLSGTLNGETVDLRLRSSGSRPRASGTVGDSRIEATVRVSRRRAVSGGVTVSAQGTFGGEPISLSGILQPQDPMANNGSALGGGEVEGVLGGHQVRLEALRGVVTIGTAPSFAAGLQGSIEGQEASIMVGLSPRNAPFFHGTVHGKIGENVVQLTVLRHPRTAHVYGVCEAPVAVALAIVWTTLRFV